MGETEARALAQEAIARGALQHVDELATLAQILDERGELRAVLEIGMHEGGTFWLWCQLATPDALLCGIDSALDEATATRCYSYRRARQRMSLFPNDSHDSAAALRVGAYCGRRLDLLFIDGDHSYGGVADDFRTYSSLVKPGGLVVLHDTALEGPGELLNELAGAAGLGYAVSELRAPDLEDPDRERAGVPSAEWGGFGILRRDDE